YQSSEDVREELKKTLGQLKSDNHFSGTRIVTPAASIKGFRRAAEVPLYSTDMLVRRADPLQKTRDADTSWVRLSPADAKKLAVTDDESVTVKHNGAQLNLPVKLDDGVAAGDVWLAAGITATAEFGPFHTDVEVEKA
ncbi:MAG: molybdopterin dinucleotide binding domain-containing protein, partial [Gammaproteobacteria bacterium]